MQPAIIHGSAENVGLFMSRVLIQKYRRYFDFKRSIKH